MPHGLDFTFRASGLWKVAKVTAFSGGVFRRLCKGCESIPRAPRYLKNGFWLLYSIGLRV